MMVGLSKMLEDRHRCKTGQLSELVDQKYGEEWLIPAV